MATLTPFGVVTTRGRPSPTPSASASASSARASSGCRGSVGGTGMRSAGGVSAMRGRPKSRHAIVLYHMPIPAAVETRRGMEGGWVQTGRCKRS